VGETEHQHKGEYRIYAVTWFWLLVITVLEVGIVLVHVPKVVLAISLTIMALMKAALIVAYFMHLRLERLSFVYTVVTPMFLGVILFFALVPDALNTLRLR
jgi:cytochrome c oxidase subunit 4